MAVYKLQLTAPITAPFAADPIALLMLNPPPPDTCEDAEPRNPDKPPNSPPKEMQHGGLQATAMTR